MLPRKTGGYSELRAALIPELLAVGVAAVLVLGLFAALLGGGSLARDKHLVAPSGCTTDTWRNPATGRIEAIGAGHAGRTGAIPCR